MIAWCARVLFSGATRSREHGGQTAGPVVFWRLTVPHGLNDGWCDDQWDGRPRSIRHSKYRDSQLALDGMHQ